jgi:hypothetical protein
MPRRALALTLLAACVALAAAGCGEDAGTPPPSTVPDKPPTTKELAQIRSTPGVPLFWLGPRYGGRELTRAKLTATEPPDSIFQYGRAACAVATGCTYDVGVATLRSRAPDTSQRCWRRLGPALVLGCDPAATLQVYSAGVEVFVTSRPHGAVVAARTLRLKRTGTSVGRRFDGLAAPKRFTCAEAKVLPAQFVATLPTQLAPGPCGKG